MAPSPNVAGIPRCHKHVRATGTEDAGPPLTALLTYANGKRGVREALSDNLESEGAALDVLASLGFDASRLVESSSDGKRETGLEPATFSLGS